METHIFVINSLESLCKGITYFSTYVVKTHTPYELDKKTPNFAQGLDFLRFQVAICTVFHEESESEVKKCLNFRARRENIRKTYLGISGSNFLFENFLFKLLGVCFQCSLIAFLLCWWGVLPFVGDPYSCY